MIDVTASITINASPAAVATVMFDPQRSPEWMKATSRVEVHDAALAPGARVTHHATFLGQAISYTTTVESVHFPHLVTMQITDGPFAGKVRLSVQRTEGGSQVQIQNQGQLTGLAAFMPESMVSGPMQQALDADLARLKAIVEGA